MNFLRFLFIAFVLMSCQSRPSGILAPQKMEEVLTDVIKADVFTQDFVPRDTSLKPAVENVKLQKQIFAYHKVTKEEFYDSYDYYLKHPDEIVPILDSIFAKQNRPQTVEKASKPKLVNSE